MNWKWAFAKWFMRCTCRSVPVCACITFLFSTQCIVFQSSAKLNQTKSNQTKMNQKSKVRYMDSRVRVCELVQAHRPIYSITCCIYAIIMLMMAILPFLSTFISLLIVFFLFTCSFFTCSFILVLKRFAKRFLNSICCRHAFLFVHTFQSNGLWFLMTIFVLLPRFIIIEMWCQ